MGGQEEGGFRRRFRGDTRLASTGSSSLFGVNREAVACRALTSALVSKEVPPNCHPLGRDNKLVIAPGLLREGIGAQKKDLHNLVEGITKAGLSDVKRVTLNGLDLDIARLSPREWDSERVWLELEW